MAENLFLTATERDVPTIEVTHDGEGFQLKSSWGSNFATAIVNEPVWGRIIAYYEQLPDVATAPNAKFIPVTCYILEIKESQPLVPKGAKLLRFPKNIGGLPQLWTLYFPPLPPAKASTSSTDAERGDMSCKPFAPSHDMGPTFDSFCAELIKGTDGSAGHEELLRKFANYIGTEEERKYWPERTDEHRERDWQRATKGGTMKGVKHWSEHGKGSKGGQSDGDTSKVAERSGTDAHSKTSKESESSKEEDDDKGGEANKTTQYRSTKTSPGDAIMLRASNVPEGPSKIDRAHIGTIGGPDCPKITVTHDGEGFKLTSSWGTIIRTMVIDEKRFGRIVCYYEAMYEDETEPSVKPIPSKIPAISIDSSPPLVPWGAKLIRFPSMGKGLPQLWTLYFPPLAPVSSTSGIEAHLDLASIPLPGMSVNDSLFDAIAQGAAGADPERFGGGDGESLRRELVEFIRNPENRRKMPEYDDADWEKTWLEATRGGTLPGVKHWRDKDGYVDAQGNGSDGGRGLGEARQMSVEPSSSETMSVASQREGSHATTVKGSDDDMQDV